MEYNPYELVATPVPNTKSATLASESTSPVFLSITRPLTVTVWAPQIVKAPQQDKKSNNKYFSIKSCVFDNDISLK